MLPLGTELNKGVTSAISDLDNGFCNLATLINKLEEKFNPVLSREDSKEVGVVAQLDRSSLSETACTLFVISNGVKILSEKVENIINRCDL